MSKKATKDGFYMKGLEGKNIFVYCWDETDAPQAAVQIFHGMAEHAGRYERLARFLNSKGLIVYANDHRGHGRTAGSLDQLGHIGKDGFNKIVEDEFIITGTIKEKYHNLPVFVIGHSFGSFVAQDFITRYGRDIMGVILLGSALLPEVKTKPGLILSAVQRAFIGEERKADLLHKLSFADFNKRFQNEDPNFAWLSRDREEVKKYIDDPYCGTVFTIGYYYYFLKGLSKLFQPGKISKIPNDLPMLIVSGTEDPVGGFGEYIKRLYQMYLDQGMKDLKLQLYPNARHEVFNEINRDEVFNDVVSWISAHIV